MSSLFEAKYSEAQIQYRLLTQTDPSITRQDTCIAIKGILNNLQKVLEQINSLSVNEKLQNYYHTYNGVLFTLDICQQLKKSDFSFEALDYLLYAILSLEENLILQDAKYLDLRTKLYIQVSKLYEQQDVLNAAIALLTSGIEKLNELMSLHQLDPPVPEHIKKIIQTNIKLLKILLIKYKIQSGVIPVVDWKKKTDQQFGSDQQTKLICLIQCLRTKRNRKVSIFQQKKPSIKDSLVSIGYQMVKTDLELLTTALEQQKTKIQKTVELQNSINLNITQEQINNEIKKKRQIQQKFIKQKEYLKASKNIPLQYHCQLVHYAFEVKSNKIFTQLSQWAVIRIKYRSIEVPYITDVSILASDSPNPNIPNQYQKLPYDLNEANLRLALTKLKNSGKINPDLVQQKEPPKQPPKDAKKAGKDSKVPQKQQPKNDNPVATAWQLEQIKHKYVFLLVKKSVHPNRAIYGIDIALGNQDKGPMDHHDSRKIIVPFIQQNVSIKISEVQQYTGVKSTTHLVPFIVLYHSVDNLNDQKERKSIVTDVKPIFGKNPMIRPDLGYNKINVDLRQVPSQFIRSKSHEYVYLTYKTDNLFNIQQRHTEILISLNELQLTYGKSNSFANSVQQQKLLQLGIDYKIQALNEFFQTTYRNLSGILGQEYYSNKTDFLTEMCSYIWIKYLRQPICQFDYLMQQRLVGETNEYDYAVFKQIIDKCKPIFLVGLKVLNLVFSSNPKCDILLVCKVNLELSKLLQNAQQYQIGIQNIRVCLQNIDKYRNQYLKKGVQGKYNKLLPFSLTVSNLRLGETLSSIKQKYLKQKIRISQMLKIRKRRQNGDRKLTQAELDEQQFEYEKKYQEYKVVNEITNFEFEKHTQIYSMITAVEMQLISCWIRLELKDGQKVKKLVKQRRKVNTKNLEDTQMQPITMKLKSSLVHQQTQIINKKNLSQLQGTLQKAGKLDPTKPAFTNHQNKLIDEINKNPYKKAILLLNLGSSNTKVQQRKYLLQQCLKTIEKAYTQQETMLSKAIDDSIYLVSTIHDTGVNQSNTLNIYPFNQVYSNDWIQQTPVPIPPILISKTSTSITMKLPPFVALVKDKDLVQRRLKKEIQSMTLYGKISANGVDVSTNSNTLSGTGIKRNISSVVQVKNLQSNSVYCFACTATNGKNQEGGIGRTGQDIGTYNPLPLNMILGALAKVTFQLNQISITKAATDKLINEFCQTTNYLDQNCQPNYLNFYRFKQNVLKGLSQIQLQYLSESLYLAARCKIINPDKDLSKTQQQYFVTNLIMLSNSLAPLLGTPLSSLTFFLPQRSIVQRGLAVNLIPPKWISPNLRMLASKIMYNVLKWGLDNNQITLARKITYKWAQRKWVLLGKLIKVQQKKQTKKGKQTKDQQIKLIDKYVRMIVQKSPGVIDRFEDALITLHDQYSDYAISSIERTKQQISTFSQYVDNSSQQIDKINAQLNNKLQFIELLKQPLSNLTKIPQAWTCYLQYSCKLLRRSIQKGGDIKTIIDGSQQITIDYSNPCIKTVKQMQDLMIESIKNDIDWAPQSVKQLIIFQQKTGQDISKTIQIFEKYIQLETLLKTQIKQEPILIQKNKQFRYNALWISELNYLRAIALIMSYTTKVPTPQFQQNYYNITCLNLEELSKKRKQMQVVDKSNYLQPQKNLEQLTKIMYHLAQAAYYSSVISNWTVLQNILKTVYNLISYCQLTPFIHLNTKVFEHLTLINFIGIQMLKKIKSKGFNVFRQQYQQRLKFKQLSIIESKVGIQFQKINFVENIQQVEYFRPSLTTEASKVFWFNEVPQLQLQVLVSVVCYNVQCLLVENKYSLSISIIRQFSNSTNHLHSLSLLPFLINSQEKLLNIAVDNLKLKKGELEQVEAKYNIWKGGKKKGLRQAQLTGEKPPQQIEFETDSLKLNETIRLIEQKVSFLKSEQRLSQKIIQEIRRDSNQISMRQKQNHRLLVQFGKDEARMFKQFGDQGRLAKNRKNTIREFRAKYESVLKSLQSSKDSKDQLSEIQNMHEAGNLAFAIGSIQDALQHWTDSLSLITKSVNPVQTYRQMLLSKQPSPVSVIGLKQTLLAINLLKKLSTVCYSKNLHLRRQSIMLGCLLTQQIYKLDSNHPSLFVLYHGYRLKQLYPQCLGLLRDNVTVNLCQLLDSCEYISWGMIDDSRPTMCLPTLCLMDYVATDIVKNNLYSMRSKLLKCLASASSGYIKQSIQGLIRCFNQKDMPIKWIQQTQYLKRQQGSNWSVEELSYNNSLPPYDKQNNQILDQVLKLQTIKKFEFSYGSINNILFQVCKAVILFSANEIEIADNAELNEQRAMLLINAENILRNSLKKLSFLQEYHVLLSIYKQTQIQFKLNQTDDQKKKKFQDAKTTVTKYLKSQIVEDADLQFYLSQDPSVEKRIERLDLIVRIRAILSKINQSRCLWTRSFYILKAGIWNLYHYSINARNVQNGAQKQNEQLVAVAQPTTGKIPKKQQKKQTKKQSKQQIKSQPVVEINQQQLKQQISNFKERTTISLFWHLKLKIQLSKLLYKQNRFVQACKLIEQIQVQATQYKQKYFNLVAEGLSIRCKLKLGQINGTQQLQKLITKWQQSKLIDVNFLELVGDCAELLPPELAQKLLSSKQKYLQQIIKQVGIKSYLLSQNYNNRSKQICAQLELSPDAQEQIKRKTIKKPIDPKKGGKDEKKPAVKKQDPKKKKQQLKADYKIPTLAKVQWINLNNQQKNNYIPINFVENSTQQDINCYIKEVPLFLRFTLRKISKHLRSPIRLLTNQSIAKCIQQLHVLNKIIQKSYGISLALVLNQQYLQSKAIELLSLLKFAQYISLNKQSLNTRLLKRFAEGLELNPQTISIPNFQQFLMETNSMFFRSIQKMKQCIDLLKNQSILHQLDFNLHEVFFQMASKYLFMARYQGRILPKYIQIEEQKKVTLLQEAKSKKLILIEEARKYLKLGMQYKKCKKQLTDNYCQIGKKAFEVGNYKLDSAIQAQILQIDYLYKKQYLPHLFDESKKKTSLNFIDILTYMLKLSRESKVMTFTSPHLQNSIIKSHKLLFNLLPNYKDKCVLKQIQSKPTKIQNSSITCLSQILDNEHKIIYILGSDQQSDNSQNIACGYILVSRKTLNDLSCSAYNLRQKMQISDKKSAAQKQRDYIFYNQTFEKLLKQFLQQFIDSQAKIRQISLSQIKQLMPKLDYTLLDILINILDQKGVSEVNKSMNKLLRYGHNLNNDK